MQAGTYLASLLLDQLSVEDGKESQPRTLAPHEVTHAAWSVLDFVFLFLELGSASSIYPSIHPSIYPTNIA